MNLLLLAFGAQAENHYQANFAILSFLKDPLIKRVIIVTDRSDFYTFLAERVEFIHIDAQTLREWQGESGFFWRIKIKALERAQQCYPTQHLLYIDSDTFLAGSIAPLYRHLQRGGGLMHKRECALGDKTDKTLRNMYRSLQGSRLAGLDIGAQSTMWNAGVIALPADKAKETIALALRLCDEICTTDCPRRLVEQFAFSLALEHSMELQPCTEIIGHYWGNKGEWNKLITEFLVNARLKDLSLSQCIAQLGEFNWRQLPLHKKQRSTNARLKAFIDRCFKDKNIQYFP
ncbi:hypothetical protein EDC45_1144 [Mesocricetibacter intestinalis]|uniref:Glycosyl transferase family 8 n=1 Tax=Mesocricetibacter intestinalis TaxID=1521930 RepID=A0A4R6V8N5_9PAST|nr:hypothetical protein [Mesocricetibacter intestinalis]TDQ58072.1 hypothetical protein EDC45_1144 [Mesocricetibacter intestinalis]